MINNVIIAGSIFMFVCVYISTFDYGQMLSKVVDDNVCMVGRPEESSGSGVIIHVYAQLS